MIWQEYRLDNVVWRVNDDLTLWRNEKGLVEIGKDALAVAIKAGNQVRGYVFQGNGKLLLDTIVETRAGAVGKSVKKEVKKPFLMIGDVQEIQRHLSVADKNDLNNMGYESEQGFINNAEDLFYRFFKKRVRAFKFCNDYSGFTCAFPNEVGGWDFLIAKDTELVYKAYDTVFISNDDRIVLKSKDGVILSNEDKSIVIG